MPWKLVVTVDGSVSRASLLNARHRVAERDARLQVEGDRDRRQLAGVADRQRPGRAVGTLATVSSGTSWPPGDRT